MKLSNINQGGLTPTNPELHSPTSFKQREPNHLNDDQEIIDVDPVDIMQKSINLVSNQPDPSPADARIPPNIANL